MSATHVFARFVRFGGHHAALDFKSQMADFKHAD
jgi:hypothetical protein